MDDEERPSRSVEAEDGRRSILRHLLGGPDLEPEEGSGTLPGPPPSLRPKTSAVERSRASLESDRTLKSLVSRKQIPNRPLEFGGLADDRRTM